MRRARPPPLFAHSRRRRRLRQTPLPAPALAARLSRPRARRDLPPRPGSVRPEADFELAWEVPERAAPRLAAIADALQRSSRLVLATDPDREGEAIAWHVLDALRASGALRAGLPVGRASFTEVTKRSVSEALAAPRPLADALVDAYRCRRALDYLVGFTLSPLLWRKLPGARSAGRVQSAALALVCEREAAVEAFRPQRYFTVQASLAAEGKKGSASADEATAPFAARLRALDGDVLGRLALGDAAAAAAAVARVEAASAAGELRVAATSERPARRAPPPPFTTSSLQQAASSQLGMSASATMSVAQRLFEGATLGEGLITYHRTDGVNVAPDAAAELRALAVARYGAASVPASGPRVYASKAKNAQEAHEAIRPTGPARTPRSLVGALPRDELALYALVWRRALASQMADAEAVRSRLDVEGGGVALRATGSRLTAPGWLAAQRDPEGAPPSAEEAAAAAAAEAVAGTEQAADGDVDEGEENDGKASASSASSDAAFEGGTATLPALRVGAGVRCASCEAAQHSTAPPARFTEGRLVQALEAAGVGRPSTYAPTLRLLLARGYVAKPFGGGALAPTALGRVVASYLAAYFAAYGPPFTARMEAQLDDVAAGALPWRAALGAFWGPFQAAAAAAAAVPTTDVIDALDAALAGALFPDDAARTCPACGQGRLGLKLSRAGGAFVGCSNYRDGACDYRAPLGPPPPPRQAGEGDEGEGGEDDGAPRREAPLGAVPLLLGHAPDTGAPVTLRLGPYGHFLQLGDSPKPGDAPPPSPPNAYLLFAREQRPAVKAAAVDGDGDATMGGVSRALGAAWRSLDAEARRPYDDAAAAAAAEAAPAAAAWAAAHPEGAPPAPKRVSLPAGPRGVAPEPPSLEDALALLALPVALGQHPAEGGEVTLHAGPYGLYVAHGAIKASLGAAATAAGPAGVTLEAALERLEAAKARGPGRRGRKAAQPQAGAAPADDAAPAAAPKAKAAKATAKAKVTAASAAKKVKKVAPKAKAGAAAAKGGKKAAAAPAESKRALTPFFAFSAMHRAEVRASGPAGAPLTLGQTAKVLGERWRALSDAERAQWGAKPAQQQE